MLPGVVTAKNLSLCGTKFHSHYTLLLSGLLKWIALGSPMWLQNLK